MPIYEEQCRACGTVNERFAARPSMDTQVCPKCGAETDRLYSLSNAHVFQPFDTRNITPDGSLLHIGSKGDLTRYCHEFGVVPADDRVPPTTRPPVTAMD